MQGKLRERAKTVWCPKPQPAILVSDELDSKFTGKEIGEVVVREKKFTGWTNMFYSCPMCPFFEEFHLENTGVFCTWPIPCEKEERK